MIDPVLIRIRPASDADASLWRLTREIAAILEAEHGARIGFATGDVDALVDVRAMIDVTLESARRLLDAGFEPDRGAARGYRFVRDGAIVDVLAPDNVGGRAELRTVPPDTTVQIVGGTQALARARVVEVDSGDGRPRVALQHWDQVGDRDAERDRVDYDGGQRAVLLFGASGCLRAGTRIQCSDREHARVRVARPGRGQPDSDHTGRPEDEATARRPRGVPAARSPRSGEYASERS